MNKKLLKKNMDSLKKVNPNLAKWIEDGKDEKWIETVNAKNGETNLLIKKNNKSMLAYGDKPRASVKMIGKHDIYFQDTGTILIGMGLGYAAMAILKKMTRGHRLVIVEPIPHIIRLAFSLNDFTKYIESLQMFIAAPEKQDIAYVINFVDMTTVIQDWFIITEKYIVWCEEYAEKAQYTVEIVNQQRCNTGTIMSAGPEIAENDIKNLPFIIKHRGVNDLKDLFKGKPAVLVCTGPSLAKNIHLLKDIQDKVIIIAVAQALRILMAYDIKPDFITTVDFGHVNIEHFEGLMDSDVPLVALNRTYAEILQRWSGPKFITVSPQPGSEDAITKILNTKGSVEQGGSVAHMSMGLADHLGCNPIIFMGQDLAYSPDFRSHIAQVDAGGEITVDKDDTIVWNVTDPKSKISDRPHLMGKITYVDGYFGDPVPTNIGLASFITSFEGKFEQNKTRTYIDATEGGAKLKGTKLMTLQKVIDTVLKDKIDKTVMEPLLTLAPDSQKLVDEVIPLMKRDMKGLDILIENANKALESADLMQKEKVKSKFIKHSADNEKYSNLAHEEAKKNNLVGVSIYHANRKIYSRALHVKGNINHLYKNKENLEVRIKRNKLILETARDTAIKLKKLYNKTIKLLVNGYEIPEQKLVSLKDVNKYFKVGNWAHPLVDVRKVKAYKLRSPDLIAKADVIEKRALGMRDKAIEKAAKDYDTDERQQKLDYNEYVELAQIAGREKKDFKKAMMYLKKANKIFADNIKARWGLATVYCRLGNYDKSIKLYEKLIVDFPKIQRMAFEHALLILEKDAKLGVDKMEEVLKNSNEFDYFISKVAEICGNWDIDKSISLYKKYLYLFPGDHEAWTKLGKQYKKLNEQTKTTNYSEKADKAFHKAEELQK